MSGRFIRNVRTAAHDPCDLRVRGARIDAIGPGRMPDPGATVEEGGGPLLLPGLVGSHAHLDRTMRLALALLARGTTCIRRHVEVDTDAGLKHLTGVRQKRAPGRVRVRDGGLV